MLLGQDGADEPDDGTSIGEGSDDTGMRMRGLSEGLEVLRPPPTWLRQTN